MPTSEIDDIFAGKSIKTSSKVKGKAKAVDESVAPSSKKKKSTKRKRQRDEGSEESGSNAVLSKTEPKQREIGRGFAADGDKSSNAKRPRIVETVADSSTSARPEIAPKPKPKTKTKSSTDGKIDDAMERFKDSRGTGPRRRTDEGFQIFKENELGIRDDGGDTPLCPFDCNCCF